MTASRSGAELKDASLRPFRNSDTAEVVALLRSVMGWGEDPRIDEFFAWKHSWNPYGASPGWIGTDPSGAIVAVRLLMRWRFRRGHECIEAVRAVDTATRSDQQGKGWFTRLTTAAVEALTDRGVGFVFNTPNDKSWPGYRKMGWVQQPSPLVLVRPRLAPAAVARVPMARAAAGKWGSPAGAASLASDLLTDERPAVARLLASRAPSDGWSSDTDDNVLAWRYGLRSLGYQVISAGHDLEEGCVIYRLRHRGRATEATICDVLTPAGSRGLEGRLIGRVLADSKADYALAAGSARVNRTLPWPRLGPRLAVRQLAAVPPSLDLRLGDLELF